MKVRLAKARMLATMANNTSMGGGAGDDLDGMAEFDDHQEVIRPQEPI